LLGDDSSVRGLTTYQLFIRRGPLKERTHNNQTRFASMSKAIANVMELLSENPAVNVLLVACLVIIALAGAARIFMHLGNRFDMQRRWDVAISRRRRHSRHL
jgi:hypothetical protein